MKRKPPPHLRADTAQRAAVRAEMHAHVDRYLDAWPHIEAAASDGISRGGGEGGSRPAPHEVDPTGNAALNSHRDPAGAWLDRFRRLRIEMRLLDARRGDLMPAKPKRGRENSVRLCALCGLPNPKMHMVDDQAYCASSCYYSFWRSRRKEASA